MDAFAPCPSCARHVKAGASTCPFCNAALPEGFGASRTITASSGSALSRAAVLFVGATSLAACSSSDTTPTPTSDAGGSDSGVTDSGAGDGSGPVAAYGPAPIPDSGTDAQPVPLYGPAPVDAGDDGGDAG